MTRAHNLERCLVALATTALVMGCQNISGLSDFVVSTETPGQAGAGNSGQGGSSGAGGDSSEGGEGGTNQEELGGSSGEGGSGGSDAGSAGNAGEGGTGGDSGSAGSSGEGGTAAGSAGSAGTGGSAGSSGSAGSAGAGGSSGSPGTNTCGTGTASGAVCTSSCDCPSNQYCSLISFSNLKTYCLTEQPAKSPIGAACSADSNCQSSYCDLFAKTCSSFCASSSECGEGNTCAWTNYGGGFTPNQCFRLCKSNSDCPPNASGLGGLCMRFENTIENFSGGACNWYGVKPPEVKTFGEIVGDSDGCDTNLVFTRSIGGVKTNYCTRFCSSAVDCQGSALSACSDLTFANPNGGGSTSHNVCLIPLATGPIAQTRRVDAGAGSFCLPPAFFCISRVPLHK